MSDTAAEKQARYAALAIFAIALSVTPVAGADEVQLDTQQQKFSYSVGLDIAQSLVRQGVEIDPAAFYLAIQDSLAGRAPRLSPQELQRVQQTQQREIARKQRALARQNLAAGQAFMTENKRKKGVKELPSGLQYKVLKKGKGRSPKRTDTVSVHYQGTLIDGREFDSSQRRGKPLTIRLDNVIAGWKEALPKMREGAKWQIVVPPKLAYGERGAGAVIGPNETLVFEIELVAIK